MTDLFLDTSTILAYLAGDEAVAKKLRGRAPRTDLLPLYEARLAQLAADVDPAEVQRNLAPFEAHATPPDPADLRAAGIIVDAARRGGRRISPVDAISLAHARRLGVPLLSANPRLDGLDGVEPLRRPK